MKALKPGTTIKIHGTSYRVLHIVEGHPRTKAAGIARAITLGRSKPEHDDRPYTALQRCDGTIFGLTAV